MAARGILRTIEGGCLGFWCPGCSEEHVVRLVQTGTPGGWTFSGDYDKPTFAPSVLVTGGHFVSWREAGSPCWCTYNAAEIAAGLEPAPFKCKRCHSFVRDGQIQFLPDCSHALAGQTVELQAMPEEGRPAR